jgi:hypothetical protein
MQDSPMIILSAGCASLAALMRDADRGAETQTQRTPIESDRRPRLISMNDGDQRAVWVSPARHTR